MKQRQRPKPQELSYTRLPSKDSDSSDETEFIVKKPPHQDIPTVEKMVEEGDTLQALSIRYHCPIAELKRLNNIHRENEIFAKNTIKVPARPFSVALASVHTSGTNSPKEPEGREVDANVLNLKLSRELLNIPKSIVTLTNTAEVNDVIFNSSVKPISKSCDNSPLTEVHLSEEVRLLPQSVSVDDAVVTKLLCNGADGGISWITLIIVIVVLIVAAPLIYVLYITEHPEEYYHSHI